MMTFEIPAQNGSMDHARLDERNRTLRNAISDGRIPVLPFELELLHAQMRFFIGEQERLGRLLGEAMEQSSETFHDNAPADAIEDDAIVLVKRVAMLQDAIRRIDTFIYPEVRSEIVTLGSLVEIVYGDDEPEVVFLTGYVRELGDEFNLPDSIEVVTVSSPLGGCLLDTREGEYCEYGAGGRKHIVTIGRVSQYHPDHVC